MEFKPIPQGPWYNPKLREGVHNAEIKSLHKGVHGKARDTYIQVVLWLPDEEVHFVSNFYLPSEKRDNRTVLRLYGLSKCIGGVPQDFIDNPESFGGEELQISIKKMKGVSGNGGRAYYDVEAFLPAGSVEPISSDKV